ncbi:hypothetical protein [Actinomadura sp. 9N215]|uniref:hypothetical protein n=1 Tax=Actinomadura sp. 9N215 TaxID=3375150 RepID=UPI00379D6A2F
MDDVRADPLEELAEQIKRRGYCAAVCEGRVVASLGVGGERVIVCDGRWFRLGGVRGHVLGKVGAEAASAERAIVVLRQIGWRS